MTTNFLKSWQGIVGLPILGLALVVGPAQVLGQQLENPIACDEASEPVELQYGAHTDTCAIDAATDLDQFTFFGATNDRIRFNMLSRTGAFDPRIEVRDPSGGVIADDFCNAPFSTNFCSFVLDVDLSQTGTFFVAVSDADTNQPGEYVMQLERIAPAISGQDLPYNTTPSDFIDPRTDMDFFAFEGVAGTDIRVTATSMRGAYDPHVEIIDPNGDIVADDFCNAPFSTNFCSVSIDLTIVESGRYHLAISDQGVNELGEYELSLQCLFGPCPQPADLVLTLSDDPDPVLAGATLTYTVVVTNNGPGDAQGVNVTTALSPALTLSSTSGCNQDPAGVPNCNLGELMQGQSAMFDIVATVDVGASGTIQSTASVDAVTSEAAAGDETATEATLVLSGDLIFRDGFEQ